ncbi:MAG: hypothetical protein ABL933_17135 [Methyloglobulus sp.]
MCKTLRIAGLVILSFILVGCAGKDFVRPSSDTFQLGQTGYSQVIQQMGEPKNVGEVIKNEKNVKSITYVYASVGGESLEEGVIPARALTYYFYNDTLVGQVFLSSFKSDNSNFDISKIEKIKKGKSTRMDVIQIFGKPTASLIPPMVKATSGKAIGYNYAATRGGAFRQPRSYIKTLQISFDDKDLVSDAEFTSSGEKE